MDRDPAAAERSGALLAASTGAAFAQTTNDTWTGGYVGLYGGVADSPEDSSSDRFVFDTNLDRVYGDTVRTATGADGTPDALTAKELGYIALRDSFYMASVTADGWPYMQHRGGPAGLLRHIAGNRIGFADYRGNKQYISTANLMGNDRVSLFLMDYPNRQRLKILVTAEATALADARDRADLLARELNHRVKNLFAVILAIVRMSSKDSPEAKPTVDRIAERINALLTAHEVTQGTLETPVASLRALVETTVRPYLTSARKADLSGPEVQLPAKQVTPLGLVLHELTTNAVKYGCWQSGGTLKVHWKQQGDTVTIEWREECPGDGVEPERQGFGSLLMTGSAKQLRGSIDRQFTKDGVEVVSICRSRIYASARKGLEEARAEIARDKDIPEDTRKQLLRTLDRQIDRWTEKEG